MKVKTRMKLAARGMGPLVRPGRPGRGRRGALAPEGGVEVADAAGGAADVQPVVRDDGPLGEFVEPSGDSVRQRVRLRPVVRDALDVEAERLGMTREGLCRFVLEEIARKAADGSLAGDGGAEDAAEGSAVGVVASEDASAIPAGYVGLGEEEDEPQARLAGAGPVVAGAGGGVDALAVPAPDPGQPAGRALLPVGRRSAGNAVPFRAVRRARRLGLLGGRARVRGARAVLAALALLAGLTAAAVVSWRYEVAETGGDGVYIVDRWRGEVWRCGATGSSRPATCALAVFRQPDAGGEAVRLGRVAP